MRLLKGIFPTVKGLEDPNFFCYRNPYIEEPTDNFVRILYCENKHWITVSGGMGLGNENICIYDGMLRDSLENHLANQLEKMMTQTERDQPYIIARVRKTQVQKRTWCGYFACAFATALCFNIDIEKITFNTDELLSHWLKCIREMKVTMFPYTEKCRVNNTKPKVLRFNRVTQQQEK